jgi:hypothetical protein
MGHGDEHHRRIAVTPFRVPISHALRAWDWRPPAARKHETRTRVADLSHASRRGDDYPPTTREQVIKVAVVQTKFVATR